MEELRAQLKAFLQAGQKAVRGYERYEKLLADPVSNAFARDEALADLADLIVALPESSLRSALDKWAAEQRTAIDRDKEEFRFGFGTQLAAGLEQAGLVPRGQLPVLRVGMFSVRVDFGAGRAVIFWGPEVERLKVVSRLAPAELAKTLTQWTRSLQEKAMDVARFDRLMRDALRRVSARAGLAEGARVPLSELHGEMVMLMQPKSFHADPSREKFAEYPRVRFSYDLFRYRTSEIAGAKVRLHVATFDATTDKTRALWVPDNEDGEGTYFAYASLGVEE